VLILIGILIGGLLGAGALISGEAIFGLLGVVIGAFIPSVFQNWSTKLDRRNQLRLAAIDRRLATHQQAYSMWSELCSKVHKTDEIGPCVMECQKWWNDNCLYLAPEARRAFKRAYLCAFNHKDFLSERLIIVKDPQANNDRLSGINDQIKENWADISGAGEEIVKGVELPTIGEDEFKRLPNDEQGYRDRKEPHSSSLPHHAASASGGLRGSADPR
jgi:hypothetical protein